VAKFRFERLSGVCVWLVNPSKRPVFRLLAIVLLSDAHTSQDHRQRDARDFGRAKAD
jgi:hypothetical protein